MSKTFGTFIAEQRQKAGLDQEQVFGKSGQGYMSSIENNKRIPSTRKGIEKLALALKLETSPRFIDWLWAYALFGQDPHEYFGRKKTENIVSETPTPYNNNHATPEICVGDTPDNVIKILGRPTKRVKYGDQMRWYYADLGLRVIFADEHVAAVESV